MPFLSEVERQSLLKLARQAVLAAVAHKELPSPIPQDGIFAEKRGVFVTLRAQGRLRGCIGVIEESEPLGEAIVRCAVSAALQDPRFSPVDTAELVGLDIEISILSPPTLLPPEDIEVGKHGLLISHGSQRGILLPQVAIEHGLSSEQFLEETCRKAGLLRDAWRDPGTLIFGFVCDVFSDSKPPAKP
jgi:AmmeMemoRadiSam system protein A